MRKAWGVLVKCAKKRPARDQQKRSKTAFIILVPRHSISTFIPSVKIYA